MDAASTEPTGLNPPPAIPCRPRRRVAWVVGVLVFVALIVVVGRWATEVRQSGVRLKTQVALRSVAQAAAVYQANHAGVPTIDDLFNTKMLDPGALREFSRAAPIGSGDVLDLVLVQTVPCRAVRKGEAWGGPGETIDHDLPACRYVLMKDWTVQEMDEPTYQQRFAPRLRLTPLR